MPSQWLMRHLFAGDERAFPLQLERVVNSVLPIKSVHEKFDIQLKPGMTYETLGSDLSTLHFLQLLVRLTGAKRVLEIGTYIGVSAMFLAEAVGEDGCVDTVETGIEFSKIARTNFINNKLRGRIALFDGVVADYVPRVLPRFYDFIFLDGAKEQYGALVAPLLNILKPGGLLVVDDVFCQGDTLNLEPTTDKGRGARDMLEQVKALGPSYSPVILPYGDGLLLLRKPA